MSIRTGSLRGALGELDPELRKELLEDYATAHRRDHCSRVDFADGWIALLRRLRQDPALQKRLLVRST